MNGHRYSTPTTDSQPIDTWNQAAYDAYNDTQRVPAGGWLANSLSLPTNTVAMHARSWSDDKTKKRSMERLTELKRWFLRYWPSSDSQPLSTAPRRALLTQVANNAQAPVLSGLPSTSTLKFILQCSLWYASSALSSNTGKTILNQFRYPVTLTLVQFGFVAFYCLLSMNPIYGASKIRAPTRAILRSTLPMGMFQVWGHMFSSMAISRIPVSTVHTIKALSPLFTVAAYALLFRVSYSPRTYISLLPLTVGVMLACSFDMSASNAIGLLCAFGSAVIFVSSNIFYKKVMPSNSDQTSSHKLDKLNLLLYSSSMAFFLMIPIWLYTDLPALRAASNEVYAGHPMTGHSHPHSVTYYFFMNGTVHFAQNFIAFIILASTSPVTYSIASLIKRVVVICVAIVWFSQSVHLVQGVGIVLTAGGLWMYNTAKESVDKGESKMRRVEAAREFMLPTTMKDEAEVKMEKVDEGITSTVATVVESAPYGRSRARTTVLPTQHRQQPTHIAPPPTTPYIHSYPSSSPQTHRQPYPNLHLKIVPEMTSLSTLQSSKTITSPTDSYPSPPPSLDSPPLSPVRHLHHHHHHAHSHPHPFGQQIAVQ
ncbi:hypothetical protein JAAARDRAFT_30746 [Jaapia argillacea MUCL 33604]|uniref:Sugar phosphate transporter domain-containing protein n=1 Tax=Jaapia argillacea MUCL 33604 TaxID=933084 RepID=A0A067Q2W0_9AGAM|nr:hypothetical protein JAAARDRAFT_30746 [Jaapia argillacea MUCL 33604]